jgi:hypothetical protein
MICLLILLLAARSSVAASYSVEVTKSYDTALLAYVQREG